MEVFIPLNNSSFRMRNIRESKLVKYSKIIEIMYITIILILISLNCCTAQVATCTDDANNNPPNVVSSSIMKSEGNPTWAASSQTIDQAAVHSIFRTMASFVAEHMDIKVLAYIDSTGNVAAAWFVHTVPKFLAHLGGYSWPAAETAKGHMFLCLSFNEAHLNLVAKANRYQEPFIYANNLSPELLNQHVELSNLITGAQIRVTPFLEHAKFATKAVANIQAFGKHTKSYLDMYARVLKNKLAANIRIWAPSDARSKSICKGQYHLREVASPMQLADSQVRREADGAKWALIEGKNIVCFTTNDYKMNEKRIAGAAVCLENAVIQMSFTTAILILISLKTCMAQVATCKDDGDRDPPNVLQTKIMLSGQNPAWARSAQSIENNNGHSIVRTMASFIQDQPNIKVLAYSDDPPNLPPRNEKSKAKGVLLIDNSGVNAAAWFVHTVPKFLSHLGDYSWPQTETPKGHIFLCLSINEESLNAVARAIRYQEPYIYASNLPPELLNQHNELSNLATGVEIRVTPFLEHTKLTTRNNGMNVEAFGKHTKSYADMYERVLRKKLSARIKIWAPSDVRSKSICKGQYHLRKIASPIQLDGDQVYREADSAKWALIDGKNTVCLTTNDYKTTEKRIPGAAVCVENANVYNAFNTAAVNVVACNMYFVYKPPNVLQTKIMQSQGRPVWGLSAQTIERDNGHSVVRTMIHFIGDNANIKVLAYSDDPPNLPPRNVKSKAKGVILIDSTGTNAATWFIHTVPNFLAYLGGYSWPQTETAKGHIFLCLSINEESLNVVAKAIRYQEPHIYVNNLPPALLTEHNELSNLVTGVEIYVTPFLEHAKFATRNNQIGANIQVFGKLTKSFADMYAKILRKKLSANIRIWAPSDARSKSICNGQYHLRKIASPMQFDGVQVSREADSAKWALVEGKSIVCLTTNDYKKYQKTMKRMFTAVIIILISLKTSTAQVATCKNDVWDNSATPIDNVQHSIGRTMANFVQNNPQIKVLAYSDDPPNIPARNQKRVLLIDMRMDDAAAWFIHTAPNFLAYLGGKAIRYQEPNIYANNLPADILNQHKELSNLVNGVEIRVTPFLEHAKFVTKRTQAEANIQAFGKHSKSFLDMYAKVLRNKLSASIRIWAPSDATSKSICGGQHKLRKIVSPMQFAGGQVHRESDSAKWALVEGKNTVCLTTNDYKTTEKRIPGAAVCVENVGVFNTFNTAAVNVVAWVLLIDKRRTDAAAWFIHTVPNFLAHLGAKAIRYQEPYIYANNLPVAILNQHEELSNLVNGVEVRVTPFLEHARFVTKRKQVEASIQAFGKHTKSFADMYARILRNKFSASIRIWAPSDVKSKSFCKGQYKLRKIASPMQFADSEVSREADSAKWALVEGKNTITEKRIPGVLLIDKRRTDAAAWFIHSVPNFLAHLGGYSWLPAETAKGHIFLCLSFREEFLNSVEVNPRWSNSAASIDVTPGQSIARTMVHYVQNDPQIKVLAYNDDPPNIPAKNRKSKAKGVLLIDKRQNDAAAWFVHTVPNFLAHLRGKAIRYQEPYIYANNLPADILNQHKELSNLVNGVEIRVTPFLENAKFVTKNAKVQANIQAFGKHSKSFADIYGRVLRNKLSANIRIWAPSDAKSKSICKGQYKLQKIDSPIQFADNQVSREADSARWALVEGKNTNSEKKVPGAAVCIENANVYNAFSQAASNVLPCNK
ncbi:Plancitoxin-1 [Trichinella patagoniensis]|uniref:Plancitoxin-1 n=1 Tax=Trichinella patagoniensis TaxID=990121 RepID=A0A0V0ZCT9_9BILA|nr:Plancitoxin-1 [Trichinella patagoniensis]